MRVLFVAYDNGSQISFPPVNYAYLASVCRKEGHDVTIYQQDTHHWPDECITNYLNNNRFDAIGIGSCAGYYQYRKVLSLAKAINNANSSPFFILGGTMATPEPEYFLRKTGADAVVMGEGEDTLCELLSAIENKSDLAGVKGIAYSQNGQVIINERRTPPDLDSLPLPAWDLFEMDHYVLKQYLPGFASLRTMPLLSGRGCSFHCTFCYRMEKGLRLRSVDSIIEEASRYVKDYDADYIHFFDELVMASPERIYELSEAMIIHGPKVNWGCTGRLNYAKHDVLQLMKQAGCVFIGYGMESMDDEVLRKMNKQLTAETITKGVEATMKNGILVGFNFIFGNPGDTPDTIKKSVDFLLKYDRQSQIRTIRPVTPYPGSPLYNLAVLQGYIKDCEDFYERKHLNSDLLSVNFTEMSDETFHKTLYDANKQLLDNYYRNLSNANHEQLKRLYFSEDASFRGFRAV